jgi:hypothetical protein
MFALPIKRLLNRLGKKNYIKNLHIELIGLILYFADNSQTRLRTVITQNGSNT